MLKRILAIAAIAALTSTSAMADFYIEYSSFDSVIKAQNAIDERKLEQYGAYVYSARIDNRLNDIYIRIDGFKTEADAKKMISEKGWTGFAYAMED